jgi:transcriptional regulator with XRE-family HTH domain
MSNGLPINSAELMRARARKGWTLRQVTERCAELDREIKVDHGNLARYEKGLIRPTPRVLLVLAQALDLSTDDLLMPPTADPERAA